MRGAVGGTEPLAALEIERPHLVLTDLVMDAMDGLRLVSEVHRIDPMLPVIMVSAHADVHDAMRTAHLAPRRFWLSHYNTKK